MRALGIWIPVTEKLPEPSTSCWVWYKQDGEEGFCERMIYSGNKGWMKNELAAIKPEYQKFIIAWQPYYEPLPYIYISQEKKKTFNSISSILLSLSLIVVVAFFMYIFYTVLNS